MKKIPVIPAIGAFALVLAAIDTVIPALAAPTTDVVGKRICYGNGAMTTYHPGGRYTSVRRDSGVKAEGRWWVQNGQICIQGKHHGECFTLDLRAGTRSGDGGGSSLGNMTARAC